MTISREPVLNQVVVDVQYARGMVYLDKCGSLLLKLEDALGKPFQGTVPQMHQAELHSTAERLVVTYGAKNFSTTQAWIETSARVEHVAPAAWELVAEALDVGRAVTRCGVRFIFLWKTESIAEAQNALTKARFLSVSPDWAALVGEGTPSAWTIVVEDRRGKLRLTMDALEINVQGGLPQDLATMVPETALMLDLDHIHPGKAPFPLPRGALKDFIRGAWQRSKEAATTMRKQLGVDLGE